ncbi:EF-hand domain-containing protein [Brevundimonas sp.]|uniref:EF-hand domain-containing protein n=1 Tax=Brevundimonas sp. TaxID=1871086 RepID=UPI00391D9E50
MIMQAKILGLAAVLGLALPLVAGCEASGENTERHAPPVVDSAPTADPVDGVTPPDSLTASDEAPAEATPSPVRSAAPRREPDPEDPAEPATEVEPLIVIGPRDGETLGEYRARAERRFNRLDTDGDGRLDREEIISGVGQVRLRNALERADVDLDDHVSRQEFNDLVTRAFQRLDADGNGVITDTEFEAGDPLAVE